MSEETGRVVKPGAGRLGFPAFVAGLLFLSTIGLSGCGDTGSYVEMKGPAATTKLRIKEKTLDVEIASDGIARRTGLMFREELGDDHGMLFVFSKPQIQSFHMRNTSVPLSIAFLSEEGKILQMEDMRPHDERPISSKEKVRYALEVNQGWFRKNGIVVGDLFDEFENSVSNFRTQ